MATATGYPRERITVIRNGVDLKRFQSVQRGEARAELGLPDDTLVIGTAGRLVPVKDQANLLNALAGLKTAGVNFTAVLAGDGPLRADLEAQACALGLGARVRFLGHRHDIERVLAALDVFVLSSRSEGLSNTILEAMASGLPVVGTRVGGAEELIEDGTTGIIVDPESPMALAAGILRLTGDRDQCRSAGDAGRRRALTQFSIGRMLSRYTELYVAMGAALTNPIRGARFAAGTPVR